MGRHRCPKSLVALTFLQFGGAVSLAIAQTCDPLPIDQLSPTRYQFWSDTPRCEGLFTKGVSGGAGMSLVSLSIGPITYDLNLDRNIEIRFADTSDAATRVQGVGVPLQLYYRLDAQFRPGQTTLQLPLRDVIAPRKIDAQQFGVYGLRALADGGVAYIPVYAGRPGAVASGDIIAVVRPGSDVTDVAWRIYGPAEARSSWIPVPDASGLVPQGRRLAVSIGAALPAPQSIFEISFYLDGIPRTDRFVILSR